MEIKRDTYLDRLIRREKNGLIKIATGVRRCGKSYLLFNLFHNYLLDKGVKEDHIIVIALDDRSNKELRDPDNMLSFVKERIVDRDTYYIILDEVQLLAEFEDVLNSFMHIRNADVYVTDSNSKFLSSDLLRNSAAAEMRSASIRSLSESIVPFMRAAPTKHGTITLPTADCR